MIRQWTQDEYLSAYRFAAEAHHGQKYPGTKLPYIMHLSFVCMEVMAACRFSQVNDESLAVQVALLHDTIEDTSVTFDDLKQTFGQSVADGVSALTKNARLEKSLQMPDSLERVKQQPVEIWIVKMADRITNLQTPPEYWNSQKIAAYRQEAIEIFNSIKGANIYLSDRLHQKIQNYPSI